MHIAPEPDPLWEAVLALHVLTGPKQSAPVALGPWRDRARVEVDERQLGGAVRMLGALAPHAAGYFPDFLTPAEAVDGLEAGLDALRGTPRRRLAHDIGFAARQRPLPSWAGDLVVGDRTRLGELTDAVQLVHNTLIAPGWSESAATVAADASVRFQAWCAGGTERLLDSLRPTLRWQPPVLEADYPAPMDLHLNGRGLRLIPSFFCFRRPVALVDHELPPVLVYPIDHAPTWAPSVPRAQHPQALATALGATRARILKCIENPVSNGQLARRLGISDSSASEHVAILRDARLAVSRRVGASVIHTLTPLGAALLHGDLPPTHHPE